MIKVEDKEIKVHKLILSTRSRYFATVFSHNFVETSNQFMEIKDFNYQTIYTMIKYLYCAEIDDLEVVAGDLFVASEKVNYTVQCEHTEVIQFTIFFS